MTIVNTNSDSATKLRRVRLEGMGGVQTFVEEADARGSLNK